MTIQLQRRGATHTLAGLLIAACFSGAGAAPGVPTVVAGQASFGQQGNVFSITNTPNTVINWSSFSVEAGEITRFIQQNADSAVLNRITGQDPTRILGALQSNGHVLLINPNGVMFGKDSRVDVNGLTASTLELSNGDFLAGKNTFKAGKQAGAIVNHGHISTPAGGKVFLIASDVKNPGVITSPQGQVVLAAGHSVQLVDPSNPDLHVVVSAPLEQAVNLGQIMSQGGRVGIYGALVNQRGVINADSAQVGANGKIVLKASRDAMLEAGSVTSATGAGTGGQVSVEGKRVGMVGDARIDASGNTGGGSVLLGGGYQGNNALMANAQHTLMGKDASIQADAIHTGNGGTVVLWGENTTRAMGRISAQGGSASGNGGLVETSGKYLDVNGIGVNAGARNGAPGTWLLDPYDIDITLSGIGLLGDADQFLDGGTGPAQINPATINSVASGTNVVLQATNNVTISNALAPNLGASGSLRIDAGNNINVNAGVSTSGGAVTLTANHPAYASGNGKVMVMPGAALNTGGGNLAISGVSADLGGTISTGGGNVAINTTSSVRFGHNVTTGNGALTVASGSIDFGGAGTSVSSGSGTMLLRSTGAFVLGPAWTLSSKSSIDIIAHSAALAGNVGGIGGMRPTLSIAPFAPGMGIDVTGGASTEGALVLNPSRLAAFDAESIILGSNATGNINFFSAYSGGLARLLTLTSQGNINIASPITLPAGAGSALTLAIDGSTASSIRTEAALAADSISMTANRVSLGGPVTGTGTVSHIRITPNAPATQIALGLGAVDEGGVMALDNGELANLRALSVQIGGNTGQAGPVAVTAGGANFSGLTPGSTLTISASGANLSLNGNLVTPGNLKLVGHHLQTAPAAKARAATIGLTSSLGVGSNVAPFNTETSALSAVNTRLSGVAPINIANVGRLTLGSIGQADATNSGPVALVNVGAMTLAAGASVSTHGSGSIALKAIGPLAINGAVTSNAGNIDLEAGSGGLLSIGSTGTVQSARGNIGLIAADIVNDGVVSTTAGRISMTAATVTGGGSFAAGGGVSGLPAAPAPAPTVPECVASPSLPDCTAIIKAAFDACLMAPTGPDCALVLPTVRACTADKTLPGCSVVLPSLQKCISDKTIPGCMVVLPTLQRCIGDKSVLGCAVVLPPIERCIGDKAILGCTVVLPTFPACVADQSILGCAVVLPTLQACIGNTALAGCTVILPTLPQCIARPGQLGCAVVLPTLPQCIANTALAGCSAVLPTLPQCVANTSLGGCSVVLPTLSQCIAEPKLAGCTVVLPTLAQCIGSPTLQGCSVVLPAVSACLANPARAGCAVVAPPFRPAPGSPQSRAILRTVTTLDASSASILNDEGRSKLDEKLEGKGRFAGALPGEKNDIRKKTYCN